MLFNRFSAKYYVSLWVMPIMESEINFCKLKSRVVDPDPELQFLILAL